MKLKVHEKEIVKARYFRKFIMLATSLIDLRNKWLERQVAYKALEIFGWGFYGFSVKFPALSEYCFLCVCDYCILLLLSDYWGLAICPLWLLVNLFNLVASLCCILEKFLSTILWLPILSSTVRFWSLPWILRVFSF